MGGKSFSITERGASAPLNRKLQKKGIARTKKKTQKLWIAKSVVMRSSVRKGGEPQKKKPRGFLQKKNEGLPLLYIFNKPRKEKKQGRQSWQAATKKEGGIQLPPSRKKKIHNGRKG